MEKRSGPNRKVKRAIIEKVEETPSGKEVRRDMG